MRTDIQNTMYYSSSTLRCCIPQITSRIWAGTDRSMRASASPVVWLWGVWSALMHQSRSSPRTIAVCLVNTHKLQMVDYVSPLAMWKVHVQVHWPFLAETFWHVTLCDRPWWLAHCKAAVEDYFQYRFIWPLFSPEPRWTTSNCLFCPTNASKTQRLFVYYHKWRRKAANPHF